MVQVSSFRAKVEIYLNNVKGALALYEEELRKDVPDPKGIGLGSVFKSLLNQPFLYGCDGTSSDVVEQDVLGLFGLGYLDKKSPFLTSFVFIMGVSGISFYRARVLKNISELSLFIRSLSENISRDVYNDPESAVCKQKVEIANSMSIINSRGLISEIESHLCSEVAILELISKFDSLPKGSDLIFNFGV